MTHDARDGMSESQSQEDASQVRMPNDADGPRIAAVAELLGDQHELLVRLGELSIRQSSLIDDDQTETLLAVLSERQGLIERLTGVGRSLEALEDDLRSLLSRGATHHGVDLARLARENALIADAVRRRDEDDRRRLGERREAIAAELAGLDQSRRAVSAYGPDGAGGVSGPTFHDTRG